MFISKIKELRMSRKISQELLAKYSDVSQMEISNIERGNKSPSINTLNKISKGFDKLEVDVCIYELIRYKCSKHDNCTRSNKPNLNCYMDLDYRVKNKDKI